MADTHHHDGAPGEHHPHVVPVSLLATVIGALMFLTVITVAASWVDLGALNVPVALAIATLKGSLVCAFFMHLRWDKPFNTIVLVTSIGFLILFLFMASLDTSEYHSTLNPEFSEREMTRLRRERAAEVIQEQKLQLDAAALSEKEIKELLYKHDDKEQASGEVDPKVKEAQITAKAFYGVLPAKAADPPNNPSTPEKVALGKALYFDGRLSKSNQISCNSCHMLEKWGVDGEPTSPGHEGQRGERNSPTTYYAALHAMQFWDGRAQTLEEQAKAPILNPVEMGMPSEGSVMERVKAIAGYADLFKQAFPQDADPVNYDNASKAIAAFERTLLPKAPLDHFIAGKADAMTAEQIEGMTLFNSVGCTQCHMGVAVGGTVFKKLGDRVPYPTQDTGRFQVTKQEGDKFVFKVPGLRNVAKTAPYFHDGSIKTLEQAVKLMAKHQLEKDLSDEDAKKIVAFLNALTGEIDPAVAKAPELPK